ncbi:MAG: hypothetical protein M3345_03370, partial [Actinomycetota bacterium]|nr:hypothetical protein [Actinomycetota bacterium]
MTETHTDQMDQQVEEATAEDPSLPENGAAETDHPAPVPVPEPGGDAPSELDSGVSGDSAPTETADEQNPDDTADAAPGLDAAEAAAPQPEAVDEPVTAEAAPVADVAEDEGEDYEEEERIIPPNERPGDWFVIHTYAGYENKVKANL